MLESMVLELMVLELMVLMMVLMMMMMMGKRRNLCLCKIHRAFKIKTDTTYA